MVYGIRVRNTNGSVQIDENYKNLSLREKITTTAIWTVDTSVFFWVANVNTTQALHMIAFTCAADVCFWSTFDNGDGTYTHSFATRYILGETPPSITFYIFGEPTPATSGWGAVVRNRVSKEVVFNSRDKYMRVTHVITDRNVEVTVPTGRVYAACIANHGKHRAIATLGGNRVRNDTLSAAATVGGKVKVAPMGQSQTLPPAPANMNGYTGSTQILVIDVTGY